MAGWFTKSWLDKSLNAFSVCPEIELARIFACATDFQFQVVCPWFMYHVLRESGLRNLVCAFIHAFWSLDFFRFVGFGIGVMNSAIRRLSTIRFVG